MCTGIRFSGENGGMYFGRNLDWSTSYGERIVVTPREYRQNWAFDQAKDPSRAQPKGGAVIGMGIIAQNTPLYFDCANEAGLAVAGLNFPGFAQYEEQPVAGKTNVAAYEFPLWVASNFTSVDEAEAALTNTAIVGKPLSKNLPVSMLHWLIADGSRSIVVEHTPQGMQVFHNNADVLTNQPGFAWHCENLRNYISVTDEFPQPAQWGAAKLSAYGSGSGMRGLPGDYYSPSRFVRAAYLNAHYPAQSGETPNVLRLFHTLSGVSMIDGAARMADGAFEKTLYTSGYSADSRTYYLRRYEDPAIQCFRLNDCELNGEELLIPSPQIWNAGN